ncbi:MAG: hypothetical protein AB7I18_03900 [Candidatus Berkiella sp.]
MYSKIWLAFCCCILSPILLAEESTKNEMECPKFVSNACDFAKQASMMNDRSYLKFEDCKRNKGKITDKTKIYVHVQYCGAVSHITCQDPNLPAVELKEIAAAYYSEYDPATKGHDLSESQLKACREAITPGMVYKNLK